MTNNKQVVAGQSSMGLQAKVAPAIEAALIQGDLSKLNVQERIIYYNKVCDSIGLNPLTKPFQYITLNGRLTLYATRDAADQLRDINDISIKITNRETISDVYIVTASASTPEGRTDESTGAVPIKGLAGDKLANALMKAETKAKRRVTLSIAGLGWLDETETETIADVKVVEPDAPRIDVHPAELIDEEVPEPLANPWEHVIESEFSAQKGKCLEQLPDRWFEHVKRDKSQQKKLTARDLVNVMQCALELEEGQRHEATV